MARPPRRTRTQAAPAVARSRGDRPVWRWAAIVVAAGVLAYSTSFRGVFVGDDIEAIVTNRHVTSLRPLWSALEAPRNTTAAGRPLVSLSLALNYAFGGLDPRGHPARPDVTNITASGSSLIPPDSSQVTSDSSVRRVRQARSEPDSFGDR